MKKKRMHKDEKRAIREKIAAILQSKGYIAFAYVFGSFAAEEDGFNDIDIAVYLSDSGGRRPLELELELEAELEEALRTTVDVRIINNAPLTFVYNVLKSGSVLLDRDSLLRADFEGCIYKKYFDFRHLCEEYLREAAHAPL